MRKLALGLLFGSVFLIAATPGDTVPAAKSGAVQVVCDDGGTNHATPVPAMPMNDRNGFGVQNLDTVNDIYCGFAANVTAATGTRVAKNGGYLPIDLKFKSAVYTDGGQGLNAKLFCTIDICSATAVNQTSPNDTRYMEVK